VPQLRRHGRVSAGEREVTKAATKAKRRRRKGITLPGGKSAPQRPTGRDRRHTNQPQEPADAVALAARARLTGCTTDEARDTLAGNDMGRCIRAMRPNPQDRRDLEAIWQGMSASWWNYSTRCLSLIPSAQSSSMPMLPEPMQTDQSLRIDPRTGEEKDEAARRVWFAWLESLMGLPAGQRHALRGHLQGYGAEVWNPDTRQPTRAGALAVAALAALHERRP
jgi:hypothetical protein